ncbi:MAG: hypothetical protein M3Y41_22325 [Pseudomonadota bacterium]|nr:hypothetical protein [Pseudomonadota bacterium]
MTTAAPTLEAKRSTLESALQTAVLEGINSQPIRAKLREVELLETAAAKAQAARDMKTEAAITAHVEAEAAVITDNIRQRHAIMLEQLAIPPEVPLATDQIEEAARDVARCEHDLAQTQIVVQERQVAASAITRRITDLDAARSAISARRQQGEGQDTDAGELQLIAVDREILEALIPAAAATLNAARDVANECVAEKTRAQKALTLSEGFALVNALTERAHSLETVFAETIRGLGQAWKLVGVRPTFIPNRETALLVGRLAAGHAP